MDMSVVTEPKITLSIEHLSTFSLAAQQNAYPIFRSLRVQYHVSDDELPQSFGALRGLAVKLSSAPEYIAAEEWVIDEISPGQTISMQQRPLSVSPNTLFELTEETTLVVTLIVCRADDPNVVYAKKDISITVLPADYWGGENRQPELLAAFVKPNGVYVESLVRQVTEVLEKSGYGRSADGYQSNTRKKPYLMAAALWNVVFAQRIAYVTPPPGFARQGQRIRLASDISTSKLGACLDTSLLFASCLELMGLNPVIALGKEHAFVGVWLIDERFPVLTNDDPMELRKRVDSRDLVLLSLIHI